MNMTPLSEVVMDSSIQCRAAIDPVTVGDYANRMGEGDKFPPVDLFGAAGRYWIGDGWHRIMAASKNGAASIDAVIHRGGRVDALKCALAANAKHGNRRTNADKRRCVEIALAESPDLSSRAIADMCGVSDPFVLQIREVLTVSTSKAAGRKARTEEPKPRRLGWVKAVAHELGGMPRGFTKWLLQDRTRPLRQNIDAKFGRPIPKYIDCGGTDARELAAIVRRVSDELAASDPARFGVATSAPKRGTPHDELAKIISALLAAGNNVEQIADKISRSVPFVQKIMFAHGLAQPGTRRGAAISPSNVIRETVNAVVATVQGLRLIDKKNVDLSAEEARELHDELCAGITSLRPLVNLLRGKFNG